MALKGPCGEKVAHYTRVEAEDVPKDLGEKATIRWLISSEDGAPLFAMRVFELEPGGYIKLHRHPWEHEIFILSGRGRIKVGDKTYDVGEGYFVYIPPNVEHEYHNTGDSVFRFLCMIPHKPSVPEGEPECKPG